jgi:hypothetical protein
MRASLAFFLMVGSCGYPPLPRFGGDAGDARADADTRETPDANLCFGSYVKVCFDAVGDVPTAPAPLPDAVLVEFDTETSTMCDQHNDRKADYCVIAGAGMVIQAGHALRAFGKKPLVLLSTTTITMSGSIDVSSNHSPGATNLGAGANPTGMCAGLVEATGNSGGYGGSFHGAGGVGASAGGGTSGGPAAAMDSFPPSLRGGCPGGNGSTMAGGTPGAGGSGGGAVALVAMTSILVDSEIRASGAGGHGGAGNTSGGGGGGSGGMIVLEAPMVMDTGGAKVWANGGGGGQGGAMLGTPGTDIGADGEESGMPMTAALGGTSTNTGGDGGSSSVGLRLFGNPGNTGGANGGGAGGGGAGFIHAPGVDPSPMHVSPSSIDLPPKS